MTDCVTGAGSSWTQRTSSQHSNEDLGGSVLTMLLYAAKLSGDVSSIGDKGKSRTSVYPTLPSQPLGALGLPSTALGLGLG